MIVLFIFEAAIFVDLRVKKAQESLVLLEVKIVFLKMWRGFYFVGEKKWLIQHGRQNIACLLYTSPSPRDRTRSRMPSSA